jgi:hypothetical protein
MLSHQLYPGPAAPSHCARKWHRLNVVMLPKHTTTSIYAKQIQAYISLLSAVSKVAAAAILRRLKAFVEAKPRPARVPIWISTRTLYATHNSFRLAEW